MKKILLAGVVGGLLMFVWSAVAWLAIFARGLHARPAGFSSPALAAGEKCPQKIVLSLAASHAG